MNIVIPTDSDNGLKSIRGAHFGRAAYYTVVECDDYKIISSRSIKNGGHEQGGCSTAVANIKKLSAEVLIVIGIGATPLQHFKDEGISVYRDGTSQTVEGAVQLILKNQLSLIEINDTCSH